MPLRQDRRATLSPARAGFADVPPPAPQLLPPSPVQARLAALAAHLVVALIALVVIGGATRVMEAGLACPDWPLCYGQWLPGGQLNLQVFLEWFHRLDAFVVGVALLVLAAAALWWRRQLPAWLPPLALAGLALVALQGGLGALTVTQLLAAPLVTAHLATALTLVALLAGLHQSLLVAPASAAAPAPQLALPRWWLALVLLALAALFAQCLLGGAMASTWSAQRCLEQGDGCALLLRHRWGARLAGLAVLALVPASWALAGPQRWLRLAAAAAGLLALVQVALGVATLRLALTVPALTIAHQFTAALLVALLAATLGRGLASRALSPSPLLGHG